MDGDGVSWGGSLRLMEDSEAPRHKRCFSDVPDAKPGQDINEGIFPAEDLIREIAALETQVVQLEQHLLSLYRKKFDQMELARFLADDKLDHSSRLEDHRLSSVVTRTKGFQSARFLSEQTARDDRMNYSSRHADHRMSRDLEVEFNSARLDFSDHSVAALKAPVRTGTAKWGEQKVLDSSINRTHSSLSRHFAVKCSTIQRIMGEAAQYSDHSLPLSMSEAQEATSGAIGQGGHFDKLGIVPGTANWISEEMVKHISAVYCALAEPPLHSQDRCSSPFSFSSARCEFSAEDQAEWWNGCLLGSHLENSFIGQKSSFCPMIEVRGISQDGEKLKDAEPTLRRFRALVLRLDKVDHGKLKHGQKLAFWINVHNALVMHAFLVYGVPESSLKRTLLVLKAAYSVGGQTVSVEMIQQSLLRCRSPRPVQWLQALLFPKTRFKASDPRRLLAIDHPEPLLHFALCTGSRSDPAVRIFRPTRVYQELEAAKDDYIQLALRVQKESKVLLPKTVESFAKDCDLSPAGFVELLEPFLSSSLRKSVKPKHRAKLWKSIRWIPHDFAFGYLFSPELVNRCNLTCVE
uniref:DUF547 domain-containing protein n=1 Tax=Kalanchoe fedtschenkoi TaxID=63787 RepID=A0A7N0T0J0_KALFE